MPKQPKQIRSGNISNIPNGHKDNTTNVSLLERLQQELSEDELLLSLNKDIVEVKDRKTLLQKIYPKLYGIFKTEDIFICRFDKDYEVIKPFLRVASKTRENSSRYRQFMESHFSIHDPYIKTTIEAQLPIISDIEVWLKKDPRPYLTILYDSGVQESLGAPIYHAGELLGVISFWADKPLNFTDSHKRLLSKIVDQIAIIMTTIIDEEMILQKSHQNDILLSVSQAIATIRDKNDLAYTIQKTLQSTLRFNDLAITKFNLAKQTFQVFLESCDKSNLHPDFEAVAFNEYPIQDGIHDRIMNANQTIILSVKDHLNKGMVHIEFLHQAGIKELAGIKLQHNDKIIGTMVLLSEEENCFTPQAKEIIKAVSHHFATAMLNIIYNEELQQRNKENEILLSASKAFSLIRKKEDLLPILKNQLENLDFYSDVSIAKIDTNQKTFSSFLSDASSNRQYDKGYTKMRMAHHSFPDGVFEVVLFSEQPVIFDLQKIMERENVPSYIEFLYRNGTRTMVGVSLRDQHKEIGALFMFSNKKQIITEWQLKIVQGIANQLGSIVATSIANEELRLKEYEKSLLLSFSKEIASVRNKEELYEVIKSKLKELFVVNGFGIGLINDDKKSHSSFLFDIDDSIREDNEFETVISTKYPIGDGFFNKVINSSEPVHFIMERQIEQPDWPLYVRFWKKRNIKVVVGMGLRVSTENIGCLFFHFDPVLIDAIEAKKQLLKGVCAQLSITLSNIRSNDRIAKQLEEISRYKEQLEEENQYLQQEVKSNYAYEEIIGNSAKMKAVFQLVSQVAPSSSTVLLLGETGTGKELIARALHNGSSRNKNLMVKVNCALLPPNLIESELFGHEKGSFTGASERRIGKFELANNGTLFLDEIGEMPADLQVKLLRALQEKEIERIGGKTTIKINVRIIAATNRDLQKEVDNEKFRKDLFYRLNIFPITLPPLRERKEDLPLLVSYFLDKYAKTAAKRIKSVSSSVLKQLSNYDWPGNVRELEHIIERVVLLTDTPVIKDIQLPAFKIDVNENMEATTLKTYVENEREHILRVLNACNGRIYGPGGAASILNLRVSTLNSKIKKLGIKKNKKYL